MTKARRGWRAGLAGVLLVGAAAAGGLAWQARQYQAALQPVGPGPLVAYELRSGQTPAQIAAELQQRGLIRSAPAFLRRARQRGVDTRLQAGWYRLSPAAPVDGLLDQLRAGQVADLRVTIPEGLWLSEAAGRCQAAGIGSAAEYQRLATREAASFKIEGLPAGATLEGYLYPDTYRLPLDAGPRELIAAQVQRFVAVWRELTTAGAPARRRHEVVILASLVEEEVRRADERAKVAGVIENRLARRMRLELCSTVIFALGEHRQRLLYRDLEVNSPYNTYRHAGLPPGPIASPGRASLQAALQPARHDDLFFVLTADGRHLFSRTAAQHARNKARGEAARSGS
ncbi:MAG: endolytic transglycosylase MltG [Fimbriimonadaceae bacterium]|nr:endolytic transglycosylase MltG [Fimbriimonadaceae bacterium]